MEEKYVLFEPKTKEHQVLYSFPGSNILSSIKKTKNSESGGKNQKSSESTDFLK